MKMQTGKPERAARQAHDQGQAERLIESGMRLLGLKEGDMATTPKGQIEKLVLGW